jgi:hypothetical protein
MDDFQVLKQFCSCEFGRAYDVWLNQSKHPEYENPLTGLTDEELFQVMSERSQDLRAIKQEFDE